MSEMKACGGCPAHAPCEGDMYGPGPGYPMCGYGTWYCGGLCIEFVTGAGGTTELCVAIFLESCTDDGEGSVSVDSRDLLRLDISLLFNISQSQTNT